MLKKLNLNKEYDPKVPLINADAKLVRIIFQNLLSNAVKYTAPGGSVGLAIKKEGEKDTHQYDIVGSEEADMQKRRISHLSPLGEALMGKGKGDSFTFDTPNGKMHYSVIDVK